MEGKSCEDCMSHWLGHRCLRFQDWSGSTLGTPQRSRAPPCVSRPTASHPSSRRRAGAGDGMAGAGILARRQWSCPRRALDQRPWSSHRDRALATAADGIGSATAGVTAGGPAIKGLIPATAHRETRVSIARVRSSRLPVHVRTAGWPLRPWISLHQSLVPRQRFTGRGAAHGLTTIGVVYVLMGGQSAEFAG